MVADGRLTSYQASQLLGTRFSSIYECNNACIIPRNGTLSSSCTVSDTFALNSSYSHVADQYPVSFPCAGTYESPACNENIFQRTTRLQIFQVETEEFIHCCQEIKTF